MVFEIQGYFLLVPFLISFSLGLVLFFRSEKAYLKINRSFALWVFTICFWYMHLIAKTAVMPDNMLKVFCRISLSGQWVVPSTFLYFVFCFTHEKITKSRLVLVFVPALFFLLLIFLDFMGYKTVIDAIRVNYYGDMGRSVVYQMYPFIGWVIYFIVYVCWGTVLLVAHIKRTTVAFYEGKLISLRHQSEFLLASGAVVIFILGLTADIIIPIFKPLVFPVSGITIVVMVLLMSYLLLKVEK